MPNFTILGVSYDPLSLEMANRCFQGWSMTNFTILGVAHSPLSLKMAKIWPYYGQNIVLIWSFELVLPES